jgi:hypothetical protein
MYNLSPTPHLSPHDILREKKLKKPIEIDEKRLRNFKTLKNSLNLSLEFLSGRSQQTIVLPAFL